MYVLNEWSPMVEHFWKNSERLKTSELKSFCFSKSSIMDFWQGPKYGSKICYIVSAKIENGKTGEENETKYEKELGKKVKSFDEA